MRDQATRRDRPTGRDRSRIDLHTHSSRSDGTDRPRDLVRAAADSGLGVVGLTDHDTLAGWDEAREEADRRGIVLVPGVEFSCRLRGHSVHLLGYLPDPAHEALAAELARIREGRSRRLPAILERLARHGMPLSAEEVSAGARAAAAIGRPHVADAMVARGYVDSREEAFDRWLSEGRPAYVVKYAPEPAIAIGLVVDAGGVAVLAHPRGRAGRRLLTDDVIADLRRRGLAGLEVDHPDHDDATRGDLRRLAGELGLLVTGSSDYHGAGRVGHRLGCCVTAPEELQRLVTAATSATSAALRAAMPTTSA